MKASWHIFEAYFETLGQMRDGYPLRFGFTASTSQFDNG